MTETDVVLRPLGVDDALAVARLHVQVWRETYAGIMSDETLAALDVDERFQLWRGWLGRADVPPSLGAFERATGELAGWITVGPARDEDAPVPRELWVLNVSRAHHGAGVAHALVGEGLGEAAAYLWVVQGNDRAITFYRKYGFALDGCTRPEDDGATEMRMVRAAAGS